MGAEQSKVNNTEITKSESVNGCYVSKKLVGTFDSTDKVSIAEPDKCVIKDQKVCSEFKNCSWDDNVGKCMLNGKDTECLSNKDNCIKKECHFINFSADIKSNIN